MSAPILFLTAATSGLLRKDAPIDHPSQPWVVSVAAELCEPDGTQIDSINLRIRAPEGKSIQAGATAVHGITSRQAAKSGVSEIAALGVLCGLAGNAGFAVGHGVGFYRDVIVSRLAQLGKPARMLDRPGLEWIDTMVQATPMCRLPGDHEDGGFRWPSLDEACETLLALEPRERPHNPLQDIERVKAIFFALRGRGVIEAEAA